MNLGRRSAAEAVGTGLLLATVVGSGIMGEQLAQGNAAITLLANALATGAGLIALILMFGAVSGAHFNPVVTLSLALSGRFPRQEVAAYLSAQAAGAVAGVWAAHLMFDQAILQLASTHRAGTALFCSEVIASFGLMMVIFGTLRSRPSATPYAVAAFITAGYWFTASTSFANPAVTIARSLSDSFAGIRPVDVPAFVAAQLVGAALATAFETWLHREPAAAMTQEAAT